MWINYTKLEPNDQNYSKFAADYNQLVYANKSNLM